MSQFWGIATQFESLMKRLGKEWRHLHNQQLKVLHISLWLLWPSANEGQTSPLKGRSKLGKKEIVCVIQKCVFSLLAKKPEKWPRYWPSAAQLQYRIALIDQTLQQMAQFQRFFANLCCFSFAVLSSTDVKRTT